MTDQNAQPGPESKRDAGGVSRRSLFRAAGAGAAVIGGGSLLEACSSSIKGASAGGSTASVSRLRPTTSMKLAPRVTGHSANGLLRTGASCRSASVGRVESAAQMRLRIGAPTESCFAG